MSAFDCARIVSPNSTSGPAAPRRIGIGRRGRVECGARGIDHVVDLRAQHAADRFVEHAPALQLRMFGQRLAPIAFEQLDLGQGLDAIRPERTPSSMSCAL